jgi:phosphate transport system substrate-binding protein
MRFFPRMFGIFILFALASQPVTLNAQSAEEVITVVGSGIVEPLFTGLAAVGEVDINLSVSVTGTATGFNRFCSGEADITLANRVINSAEISNCVANDITYIDLLLGHDVAALITNPQADFIFCLDIEQLNLALAPSSQNEITNWNQILEEAEDIPLSLYLPGEATSTYAIMDRIIEGDGIRTDSVTALTENIIAAVAENIGALGIVPLPTAQAAGDIIRIVELDAGDIPGCRQAGAEDVEDNLYPAADKLYAYININSLEKGSLADMLEFTISDQAKAVVENLAFISPTQAAYQLNRDQLEAALTGAPVPRATDDFTLPTGLAGDVILGGAAGGYPYAQALANNFRNLNPDITVDIRIQGEPVGFRRLCNGEIDMAFAYRDLTPEEVTNCEANNIATINIDLGSQAVVLIANSDTEFLSCLTTEALTSIWSAAAGENIVSWNQVDMAFADLPMTLFAPALGDLKADLLLNQASGQASAIRADTEQNNDPLYRAAATANVEGSLAFMSWLDYLAVRANNQDRITLVAIDRGDGCITPSLETITNQSYALARPLRLIVNSDALANPEVQAFLWFLASNESYPLLEDNEILGLRFGDLPALRASLQTAFALAEARAAERLAETENTETEATVEAETPEDAGATEEAETGE